MAETRLSVENEFANVEVSLDRQGNGPRLKVVDRKTGGAAFLDALQLESLVWATAAQMNMLLDPGARDGHEEAGAM